MVHSAFAGLMLFSESILSVSAFSNPRGLDRLGKKPSVLAQFSIEIALRSVFHCDVVKKIVPYQFELRQHVDNLLL